MYSTQGRVNRLKQEVAASDQTYFKKLKAWINANLITIIILTAGIITVGVSTVFAVYTGETETTTPGPAKRIKMRTYFNTNQTDVGQFQSELDAARQNVVSSADFLLHPFYVGELAKSLKRLRSKRRFPLMSRQSSDFTGYTYYQTSCDSVDACFTERQDLLTKTFVGIANSIRFDFEEMDVDQAEWDRIQTLVKNSTDHTYAQNLDFEGEVELDGDVSADPLPTGPLANEMTSNIKAIDPNGAIGSFSVFEASLSDPAGRKRSVLILKMKLRVVFKKGRHNELSEDQLSVKIKTVLKVSTISTSDGQKVKITAITNVKISFGSLDDATDNESEEANVTTPRPLPPPVDPPLSACGLNWTYYADITSNCREYYNCKTGDYGGECQDGYMYHNVTQTCQPEHTFNCSDFEEAPSFARYSPAKLVGLSEDQSLIEPKICEILINNASVVGIPYYIQLGNFSDGMFDVTLFYRNDLIQCSNSITQCTSALNSLFIGVEYNEDGSLFSIMGYDFSKESVASESEWETVQSNRGKCIPTALKALLTIDPKDEPEEKISFSESADETKLIKNLLCDRFINADKSIGTAPLYWVFNDVSSELTVYYQFPVVACAVGDSKCDDFITGSIPAKSPLVPPLGVFANKETVTVKALNLNSPVNVTHADLKPVQDALKECEAKRLQSFKRVKIEIKSKKDAKEGEGEEAKENEWIQTESCQVIYSLRSSSFPKEFIPIYIAVGEEIEKAASAPTGTSFDAYIYYNHNVSNENLDELKKAIDAYFNKIFTYKAEDFTELDEADINETDEVNKRLGECVIGQSAIAKITVTSPALPDSSADHTAAFENLVCEMLLNPRHADTDKPFGTMPYFAKFSNTANTDGLYDLMLYYKNRGECEDDTQCKEFVTRNVHNKNLYPLGEEYKLAFDDDDDETGDFTIHEDGFKLGDVEGFDAGLATCVEKYKGVYKKFTAAVTPEPPEIATGNAKEIEQGFCEELQGIYDLFKPAYIVIKELAGDSPKYRALIYYENHLQCGGDNCEKVIGELESKDKNGKKVKIDVTSFKAVANPITIRESEEVKKRIFNDCKGPE